MGAACARRRAPLVAEGETPFWEELDRAAAPATAAPGAADAAEVTEVVEKDEVELPGPGGSLGQLLLGGDCNMFDL